MLSINPYLNFAGNTEEAFNFYKEVFGGEFSSMMRFKDMPENEMPMPENEAEKVMHVSLPLGGNHYLMGSDVPSSMSGNFKMGTNTYISLHPDSLEEAQRLYNALSAGGRIEMPLEKMFWGDYYAAFEDQFGVMWMINYHEQNHSE